MHSIDNGFSYTVKRDNWIQIDNYLKQQDLIKTLKNENIEKIINNKNNEVLTFVIKLYQELTNRKLAIFEGVKIKTDTDNVNKSYLLKETGDLELINKNRESLPEHKSEELQKSISIIK
jgi:hypothetical protein